MRRADRDSLAGEEVSAIVTLSGPERIRACYNREEAKYTLAAGLNERSFIFTSAYWHYHGDNEIGHDRRRL